MGENSFLNQSSISINYTDADFSDFCNDYIVEKENDENIQLVESEIALKPKIGIAKINVPPKPRKSNKEQGNRLKDFPKKFTSPNSRDVLSPKHGSSSKKAAFGKITDTKLQSRPLAQKVNLSSSDESSGIISNRSMNMREDESFDVAGNPFGDSPVRNNRNTEVIHVKRKSRAKTPGSINDLSKRSICSQGVLELDESHEDHPLRKAVKKAGQNFDKKEDLAKAKKGDKWDKKRGSEGSIDSEAGERMAMISLEDEVGSIGDLNTSFEPGIPSMLLIGKSPKSSNKKGKAVSKQLAQDAGEPTKKTLNFHNKFISSIKNSISGSKIVGEISMKKGNAQPGELQPIIAGPTRAAPEPIAERSTKPEVFPQAFQKSPIILSPTPANSGSGIEPSSNERLAGPKRPEDGRRPESGGLNANLTGNNFAVAIVEREKAEGSALSTAAFEKKAGTGSSKEGFAKKANISEDSCLAEILVEKKPPMLDPKYLVESKTLEGSRTSGNFLGNNNLFNLGPSDSVRLKDSTATCQFGPNSQTGGHDHQASPQRGAPSESLKISEAAAGNAQLQEPNKELPEEEWHSCVDFAGYIYVDEEEMEGCERNFQAACQEAVVLESKKLVQNIVIMEEDMEESINNIVVEIEPRERSFGNMDNRSSSRIMEREGTPSSNLPAELLSNPDCPQGENMVSNPFQNNTLISNESNDCRRELKGTGLLQGMRKDYGEFNHQVSSYLLEENNSFEGAEIQYSFTKEIDNPCGDYENLHMLHEVGVCDAKFIMLKKDTEQGFAATAKFSTGLLPPDRGELSPYSVAVRKGSDCPENLFGLLDDQGEVYRNENINTPEITLNSQNNSGKKLDSHSNTKRFRMSSQRKSNLKNVGEEEEEELEEENRHNFEEARPPKSFSRDVIDQSDYAVVKREEEYSFTLSPPHGPVAQQQKEDVSFSEENNNNSFVNSTQYNNREFSQGVDLVRSNIFFDKKNENNTTTYQCISTLYEDFANPRHMSPNLSAIEKLGEANLLARSRKVNGRKDSGLTLEHLIASVQDPQQVAIPNQPASTIDEYYKKFLDSPMRNIEKELNQESETSSLAESAQKEASKQSRSNTEQGEEEEEEENEDEEEETEQSEDANESNKFRSLVEEDRRSEESPFKLREEKTPFGIEMDRGFDSITPIGRSPFRENTSCIRDNLSMLQDNKTLKDNFRDVSPIKPTTELKTYTSQDSIRMTSMMSPSGMVVENLMERFQRQTNEEIEEIIQKHTKGIKLTPSKSRNKENLSKDMPFLKKGSPKALLQPSNRSYFENTHHILKNLETLESFQQEEIGQGNEAHFPSSFGVGGGSENQRELLGNARSYYERFVCLEDQSLVKIGTEAKEERAKNCFFSPERMLDSRGAANERDYHSTSYCRAQDLASAKERGETSQANVASVVKAYTSQSVSYSSSVRSPERSLPMKSPERITEPPTSSEVKASNGTGRIPVKLTLSSKPSNASKSTTANAKPAANGKKTSALTPKSYVENIIEATTSKKGPKQSAGEEERSDARGFVGASKKNGPQVLQNITNVSSAKIQPLASMKKQQAANPKQQAASKTNEAAGKDFKKKQGAGLKKL